jgi:hypothetical protein
VLERIDGIRRVVTRQTATFIYIGNLNRHVLRDEKINILIMQVFVC